MGCLYHPYLIWASPNSIVYGTEAILHVEVEICYLQVLMKPKLEEAK